MKAFLIDPFRRAVDEVQYDGSLEDMYRLLGCDDVNAVRLNREGDTVWVDGEGLLKNPTHFFYIGDYPQELAGKGLVLGTDGAGCSTAPVALDRKKLLMSVAYMQMDKGMYSPPPIIITLQEP